MGAWTPPRVPALSFGSGTRTIPSPPRRGRRGTLFSRSPCVTLALAPARAATRRLSICLVNPRFEPSYWGFDYALPLYPGDKRCTMITGALPALAGLVPAGHEVVLLDENVQPIDFEALRRFDI